MTEPPTCGWWVCSVAPGTSSWLPGAFQPVRKPVDRVGRQVALPTEGGVTSFPPSVVSSEAKLARTTADQVKAILMSDYGPKRSGDLPDLAPFIRAAGLMIDRVATCATAKGLTLTSAELVELECWLAAHFYSVSDRPYQSTSTDRAGATYQGRTGMGLDSSYYGQTAMILDYSGCLAAIASRRRASITSIGKRPDDATEYEDRG